MSYNYQKHCYCFYKINIIILLHLNQHFSPLHSNVRYCYQMSCRIFQIQGFSLPAWDSVLSQVAQKRQLENFSVIFYGIRLFYHRLSRNMKVLLLFGQHMRGMQEPNYYCCLHHRIFLFHSR